MVFKKRRKKKDWIIVHCMETPQFFYPFSVDGPVGCFHTTFVYLEKTEKNNENGSLRGWKEQNGNKNCMGIGLKIPWINKCLPNSKTNLSQEGWNSSQVASRLNWWTYWPAASQSKACRLKDVIDFWGAFWSCEWETWAWGRKTEI